MGESDSRIKLFPVLNDSVKYDLIVELNSTLNSNLNISSSIESERRQDIIYLTLYSLTCVVALFGNIIVCKVVFGKRSMRSFTNLLLANMAISDILCALMFPLGLIVCWNGFMESVGNKPCIVAKVIQLMSFQVSSVTMTFVAIDRWMLVYFPMTRSHRIIPVWGVILSVWMLSFALIVGTSPSLAYHRYFIPDKPFIKCEVVPAFSLHVLSPKEQRIRLIIANLAHFWIPLLVITVSYSSICWKVSKRKINQMDMTLSQQDAILRTKWKTIKMLIVAVVVFFMCWFPFFIFNLIDFFWNPHRGRPCNKTGPFFIAVWIAFTSCSYNPFVYWICSQEFRDGLRDVGKLATSPRPSLVSFISSFKDRVNSRKSSQNSQQSSIHRRPSQP